MDGLRALFSKRSLISLFDRQMGRGYVPELDGLRSISILLVMIWHASLRATRYYGGTEGDQKHSLYSVFPHGEVGVLIFFVISGFVVSIPYLKRVGDRPETWNFFSRRLVRIYPPYLVALTAAYFALGVLGHVPRAANSYQESSLPLWQSFAASLFYLHGAIFNAPSRLNPPMWSLELEIGFYALVPLMMAAYLSRPKPIARVSALVSIVLLLVALSSTDAVSTGHGYRFREGPIHYGYYFLAGLLCAEYFVHDRKRSFAPMVWDSLFILSFVAILAFGIGLTRLDATIPTGQGWFMFRVLLLASIVLLIVSALNGRRASRFLSSASVRSVGVCCYSLYLTHVPVMQGVSELLSKYLKLDSAVEIWAVWLVSLSIASLLCGFAFYVVVERPFALAAGRLGRAPSNKRPMPAGVALH